MKPLNDKKAIALYETHIRPGYVVKTVVFYILAAILWYALAVILPYSVTMTVSAEDNAKITRAAFTASQEEILRDESWKERALLMPTSESSYYRRLRLIEDAESSIDYMVYDTYEESFSYYYYTALIRAADRGVRVRIVLDGKMGRLSGTLSDLERIILNHNNMQLYYFNSLNLLYPAGLMVLMHDKVTIVDNKIVICGGVNMGTSAYLYNYDMEVMITNSGAGGCAGQARDYFERILSSGLAELQCGKGAKKDDLSIKNRYIDEFNAFFGKTEFADARIDYSAQGIAVDKVTFVANEISENKKAPIVLQAVFNLMESAKKTTVVTPYTLLENDKKDRLKALAAKNDEFTIVTNSLYNSRNVGYADYHFTRKAYIDENIRLLEFMADNQLHAKMFSFDGRLSVIGSFNLDERSAHIDTESVLVIDSAAFNAQLNEYIDKTFISDSLQVGADNKYIPSETVENKPVSFGKKFKYWIYSALGLLRCLL